MKHNNNNNKDDDDGINNRISSVFIKWVMLVSKIMNNWIFNEVCKINIFLRGEKLKYLFNMF